MKAFQAFFTAHAGEIVLTVIFGIRLIFSKKNVAYRFFIFGILFILLFILDHMDVQEFNPFSNLTVSNNVVTAIFLGFYALYVLFFDHD